MTSTHTEAGRQELPPTGKQGFTVWPLWAALAGALGFAGSIIFDVRPAAETEAFANGEIYTVSPDDMLGLDATMGRLGWMAGLASIVALLVFAAVWARAAHRFPRSAGARVVTFGLIATAAAGTLGYGWKGALANYLGTESGLYDERGLFVYYMLTDFGAYFPWFGVLVSALAFAWIAWTERLVSRVLGTVSAVFAVGLGVFMLITGVPGIPGTLMQVWLIIAGTWLALGRSRVTAVEDPA